MKKPIYRALLGALFGIISTSLAMLPSWANAQQTATSGPYMVQLATDEKSIPIRSETTLDLFVMDAKSMAPVPGLTITGSLDMPEMGGMDLKTPVFSAGSQPGHYNAVVSLPMKGSYRLDLKLQPAKGEATSLSLTITPAGTAAPAQKQTGMGNMAGMAGMEGGMQMKGTFGEWTANREGSGTSWQPDSSPMFMKMLPSSGRYDIGMMGTLQTGYVDAGGKRGDKQFYANSMIMWMGRRETGGGILGLNFMTSFDAITNGKKGVPNLFQTGETFNGKPLVDRQHPHDLFAEAAVSFSKPISRDIRGFVYAGPIGEPALGNVMFMHRASGMEIPEAPISHHWFDSTHVSFGVATLGLTLKDKWKLEGSAFNGHEPNENRFDIEPIQLNSGSGRISFNPDKDWSLSASYGFLKSPEALEPGLDQHRVTASANYNQALGNGDDWATSFIFGRLIVPGKKDSNAYLLESTLYHHNDAFFGRLERVDKDELVGVPAGSYTVNKLLLGDVRNVASRNGFDYGIGGYFGLYSFPSALDSFYGSHPVTWGVFLRVRPSKM
jgi:hypothetical protein